MYEIPLDDIHRLLDKLADAVPAIERRPTDSIQVITLSELSEAVLEVLDWSNTAYIENKLGVNASLLSKFVKMRGVVRKRDALKLADRLRTYLKSEDQSYDAEAKKVTPTLQAPKLMVAPPKSKAFTVDAERWIELGLSSEIKAKIAVIASLLDSIIEQVSGANAPREDQILSRIERQQLMAILETSLNVLKSPMVEKGLLQKAKGVLARGAQSAVEKGVQQGLGLLMQSTGERILELLRMLGGS